MMRRWSRWRGVVDGVDCAVVPLTAAVLTADGGRGGLVWTLVADAAGVMAVATDGALVGDGDAAEREFCDGVGGGGGCGDVEPGDDGGDDVFLCAAGVFAEFGELFGGAEFCRGWRII